MNFYLAGAFDRREELAGYAEELEALGFGVTAGWLRKCDDLPMDAYGEDKLSEFAEMDFRDIVRADSLIAFTEHPCDRWLSGGRHVETGIALMSWWPASLGRTKQRLYIVGPRENIFHYLSCFQQFDTFADLVSHLVGERRPVGV